MDGLEPELPEPRFTVYVPFTVSPQALLDRGRQDPSLCLATPGSRSTSPPLPAGPGSSDRTYLGRVLLARGNAQRSGQCSSTAHKRRCAPSSTPRFHASPRRPPSSPPRRPEPAWAIRTRQFSAMLCTVAPMRNQHAGLPFTTSDEEIEALLLDVSIPTLMLSLVHMTGDPELIRRPAEAGGSVPQRGAGLHERGGQGRGASPRPRRHPRVPRPRLPGAEPISAELMHGDDGLARLRGRARRVRPRC